MQVLENWLDMHLKLSFVLTALKIPKTGCSSFLCLLVLRFKLERMENITTQCYLIAKNANLQQTSATKKRVRFD